MQWIKGQPWRVVHSLDKLNEQIRAYAPRSVPPATDPNAWGALADDAHSSSSDHYPHFYSALGMMAVVCARDFPQAPSLGLDGGVVTEALRVSRDPRIGYVIFNRRITGPNHGWQWEHYDGSDPHDTHFHVSSVHTAIADDTRAWTLPGGTVAEFTQQQINDIVYTLVSNPSGPIHARITDLKTEVDGIKADVAAIKANGSIAADVAAALAGNQAFLTAIANAVGASVKDQFGPAFDARIVAAVNVAEDS